MSLSPISYRDRVYIVEDIILILQTMAAIAVIGGGVFALVPLQQQQASASQYYTCNTNGDITCKHQATNNYKDKTPFILPFP